MAVFPADAPAEPTEAPAAASSSDSATASSTQPALAIEAPPPVDDTIKLDVGRGAPVSLFDKLGPTIVSKDGVSPLAPVLDQPYAFPS